MSDTTPDVVGERRRKFEVELRSSLSQSCGCAASSLSSSVHHHVGGRVTVSGGMGSVTIDEYRLNVRCDLHDRGAGKALVLRGKLQ